MHSDLWLYVLQAVTIAVTLVLGVCNARMTRRIQKGRNIVEITTQYRLDRMKAQQQALCRLLTDASPVNLKLNASSAREMAGRAIGAAAAFESMLHLCFDRDRELVEQIRLTAEAAAAFARSVAEGGCDPELERILAWRLRMASNLCDKYVAAEWARIKRETEGRNTKTEEWYAAYEEICCRYKELDRKLQAENPVCEK